MLNIAAQEIQLAQNVIRPVRINKSASFEQSILSDLSAIGNTSVGEICPNTRHRVFGAVCKQRVGYRTVCWTRIDRW